MKYLEGHVKSRGYTLIEIMVALAVFSIFVVGVYEVYNNVHDTWQSEEMKASAQQAGRATLNYMQRDLMMAGYRSADYNTFFHGSSGIKGAANKIVLANVSSICFDRYMDDIGDNRLVMYSFSNGALYRNVYTQYNDTTKMPATLDTTHFVANQKVADNISQLKFLYYKIDTTGTVTPCTDSDLQTSSLMRSASTPPGPTVIAKIHVIMVQRSEKKDPRTGNYYYVTNDITVTPVNLRTTETVGDKSAPAIPTGLNVVDSQACSSLKCKWNANTDPDLAGYAIQWGRDPSGAELPSPITIPLSALPDKSHPSYTINGLVITQKHPAVPGTVNTYYVSVCAYDVSGNYSHYCAQVSGNPDPSITAFGSNNDTTVNVLPPSAGPTNLKAYNIIDDPSVGQNQVKLTWTSSPDASTGYRLYRITGSSGFTYPIANSYLIADETTLTSGVTSYIDKDASLVTCQDYTYALCSVNCDPTLVQDYTSPQFSTIVKDPTNTEDTTPPDITGTRPGWKRIFINLKNPVRTAYDADFLYTMVYFNEGDISPVDMNPDSPTYGQQVAGSVIPNSDCGVPGRFQTSGTVPTIIFSDPTIPAKDPPDLDNGQNYTLVAVSYYKCRGIKTASNVSQTLTTLCGDDTDFPGAPPMKDSLGNTALATVTGGGCIYSPFGTAVEYNMPIQLNWTYSLQNQIYDYAGLYIYKKNHTDTNWTYMTGPVWTGPILDANVVAGNQYDYMFKLADCAYVNASATAQTTPCGPSIPSAGPPDYGYACDITADADAVVLKGLAPGDIQKQAGGVVNTFGTATSINGSFYHNAVKFNINNTANCDVKLTSLDNITWDNPAAYLKTVTIGPSAGNTTAYTYSLAVPGGSPLLSDGLHRTATVNGLNALLQDHGVPSVPSIPIPVTFVFETGAGGVDQTVDMRASNITLNAEYTNSSTNETTCARNSSVYITLGPSVVGVAQDQPVNPTFSYDVPGDSGTNTAPNVVVNGGLKVNVSGTALSNTFRNTSSIPMSSVSLYYRTTDQGTANPPAPTGPTDPAWTCLPMALSSTSSNLYTLFNGTDNRIPTLEGDRIWYYIVAKDADGNFDRAPEPENGYYTYDQKSFSVCDETPSAPVLTNPPTLSGGPTTYSVTLNWTLPGGGSTTGTYLDGNIIGAIQPDPITYDVYKKIGNGTWSIPTGGGDLTTLTWTDPSVTQSTEYKVVAKNSCSSPGPNISPDSNLAAVCLGTGLTRVDLAPSSAVITMNWSTGVGNKVPVNFDVFKCSAVGISHADITMTVSSAGGGSQDITLKEDGVSGYFYLNGSAHTPMQITAQSSLFGPGVQGATTMTNLADTVTFTDDNTGVYSTLTVNTDPACNTPKQVTGANLSVSGNNVTVNWTAVTNNTDGSTMNDLSGYNIYVTEPGQLPALVGSVSKATLSYGFKKNSYPSGSEVQVSAVDSAGNIGAMSTALQFN
jgi:prepilin-type N-terminal cleavage/methylation domain-containing protein